MPVLRQASPNVPLCICRLVEASMMTFLLLQLEKMATGKVARDLKTMNIKSGQLVGTRNCFVHSVHRLLYTLK